MAFWEDHTIRMSTEGVLERAPDGTVHLTWLEGGSTFTLIVTDEEFRRLRAAYERARIEVLPSEQAG
jgi:hypothetical protein